MAHRNVKKTRESQASAAGAYTRNRLPACLAHEAEIEADTRHIYLKSNISSYSYTANVAMLHTCHCMGTKRTKNLCISI